MREDSELPALPDVMTVKEVAERLDISERMVHAYVQDGRLAGHKLGKMVAIRKEDFLAFERAKKGRPRTRLPVWRKSVGDNLQYMTIITTRIKAGQKSELLKKLEELRTKGAHMLPGTVNRFIACSEDDPDDVQIVLIWRSTVMPEKEGREAEIQALKEELAEVLDWEKLWRVHGRVLLHT
jgi:excisionase family DNA binding protein